MGLFRPARTVTGPTGAYWELYVSKVALPSWREGGYSGTEYQGEGQVDPISLALELLHTIWAILVVPLLRVLALLPVAVVRGRRSRAVRIEAVNPYPVREVLLWTTTDERAEIVLDEIAAALAAGKVAQPEGAVFSGREPG